MQVVNFDFFLFFNHSYIENCCHIPAAPCIFAFTKANTIEIRLIVNGNLVHTMVFPHLKHIASKVNLDFDLHFYIVLHIFDLICTRFLREYSQISFK